MATFSKTRGYNILLNTDEFSGGSGILDNNSLNVQKAFKDINERLNLVTEEYDGFMSSKDKIKLDSIDETVNAKKLSLIFS